MRQLGLINDVLTLITHNCPQSVKQNSMLDLEIADYERTISALHSQVAERDRKIEEIKMEIDKQEQTMSLMQTQIGKFILSEETRMTVSFSFKHTPMCLCNCFLIQFTLYSDDNKFKIIFSY